MEDGDIAQTLINWNVAARNNRGTIGAASIQTDEGRTAAQAGAQAGDRDRVGARKDDSSDGTENSIQLPAAIRIITVMRACGLGEDATTGGITNVPTEILHLEGIHIPEAVDQGEDLDDLVGEDEFDGDICIIGTKVELVEADIGNQGDRSGEGIGGLLDESVALRIGRLWHGHDIEIRGSHEISRDESGKEGSD